MECAARCAGQEIPFRIVPAADEAIGSEADVVTFDTGRLFPETLGVWDDTERHYGRQMRGLAPDRDSIESLSSAMV